MAFQFSTAARNAALDQMETTIGTAPTLTIRSGAAPANCAAARSGTVLVTIVLPSDWLLAASGGVKAINGGPWQDAAADATGTAAHFSIDQGATCHLQGTVGVSASDINLDSVSITAGQQVSITAFNITAGGA